jgi:hypothetical protein
MVHSPFARIIYSSWDGERADPDCTAEQSLAADGAIACFSSNFFPLSLNADRAPQLRAGVGRLLFSLRGILFMQLKTASAIAIACLSIGALLNLTGSIAGTIWMHHWYLSMGIQKPGLSLFWSTMASVVGVLLFHGPLILFFVVFYRNQTKDALSGQML